jgi:hypothetical protein
MSHIDKDGKFQSDKFPWCQAGFVPLKTTDKLAQDLLWEYAERKRVKDAEFSKDLQCVLIADGFQPPPKE